MKVLVTYLSHTGNTRKVAEAIFQAIDAEKEIQPLEETESLKGYDLAFVGFPIQMGPAQPAKEFLEAQAASQRIALFVTHGAPEGDEALQGWLAQCRAAAGAGDVVGLFDCQGAISERVKQAMRQHPDPQMRAWVEGDTSQGQPDATRLERAAAFALEIVAQNA